MRLEAFDPAALSRAFVFHGEAQSLAAIIDGVSSWGSGREAAEWAREELARLWQDCRSWSSDSIARDVAQVTAAVPDSLRAADFGWSFSVSCLLVTGQLIECVAAGFYRVDVLSSAGLSTLFRPQMLLDQLLANGTLTPETAEVFPHRDICVGPFVGDANVTEDTLTCANHVLAPHEVVIVTHVNRYDLTALHMPQSAEALAAMARTDAYPSPVIVARSSLDA